MVSWEPARGHDAAAPHGVGQRVALVQKGEPCLALNASPEHSVDHYADWPAQKMLTAAQAGKGRGFDEEVAKVH